MIMNWNIDTQSLGDALKGTVGPSTIAERFNCLSFTTTTTKLYTNIYIVTVLMFIPTTISQFECFIRISSKFFWIMLWLYYLQKTSEITSIFVMIQTHILYVRIWQNQASQSGRSKKWSQKDTFYPASVVWCSSQVSWYKILCWKSVVQKLCDLNDIEEVGEYAVVYPAPNIAKEPKLGIISCHTRTDNNNNTNTKQKYKLKKNKKSITKSRIYNDTNSLEIRYTSCKQIQPNYN